MRSSASVDGAGFVFWKLLHNSVEDPRMHVHSLQVESVYNVTGREFSSFLCCTLFNACRKQMLIQCRIDEILFQNRAYYGGLLRCRLLDKRNIRGADK